MHKKALTVAIAGALAAPLAAQAVDFTISGHINRALFVTDGDASSKAEIKNNGGSSTRVRANGSTELMDGNTVGIQLEYEEKDSGVNLRHANLQYGGAFGKATIGQGSEAGDGSQYSDTTGVFGIGHGAGTGAGFSLGDYFGSLDSGSRKEMIRYDTPALGPLSAAVSVANGDRVSGLLKLSSEFGGSTFGAQLGMLQWTAEGPKTENPSSVGASFGVTMASGLTFSGAWAKGSNMMGELVEGTPGQPRIVWVVNTQQGLNSDGEFVTDTGDTTTFQEALTPLEAAITAGEASDASDEVKRTAATAKESRDKLFETYQCTLAERDEEIGDAPYSGNCRPLVRQQAVAAGADTQHVTDPHYFQVEVGYKFGNTGVAVSWYQSKDFEQEGSKGTALGIGARHTLPKAGAELYAALQNYDVTPTAGADSVDETVFMLGTRVKF